MQSFSLDIDQIANLETQVAYNGTIRTTDLAADAMFAELIGIAVLINRQHPF